MWEEEEEGEEEPESCFGTTRRDESGCTPPRAESCIHTYTYTGLRYVPLRTHTHTHTWVGCPDKYYTGPCGADQVRLTGAHSTALGSLASLSLSLAGCIVLSYMGRGQLKPQCVHEENTQVICVVLPCNAATIHPLTLASCGPTPMFVIWKRASFVTLAWQGFGGGGGGGRPAIVL